MSAGLTQCAKFAVGMSARFGGVSMMLGRIALTVMSFSLSSSASASVNLKMPAFDAAYAPMPVPALSAPIAPMLTMLPALLLARNGSAAWLAATAVRRFTL